MLWQKEYLFKSMVNIGNREHLRSTVHNMQGAGKYDPLLLVFIQPLGRFGIASVYKFVYCIVEENRTIHLKFMYKIRTP